jgi:hypothetical protein
MATSARVTIGFHGGQVLALRLSTDQRTRLEKALAGGGWHELSSEDGPVRLDLSQVVYVSSDADEPQVGFG